MRKKLSIGFLLVLIAVALYLTYLVLNSFLSPILTAAVLAIAFFPLYDWMERRMGGARRAAVATILIIVLAILAPAMFVGFTAASEIRGLIDSIKQHSAESGGLMQYVDIVTNRVLAVAGRYVDTSTIDTKAQIVNALQKLRGPLLAGVGSLLSNLASLAGTSLLVLFVMYFLFSEGRAIKDKCARVMPLDQPVIDLLFQGVANTIRASMMGMLVVAIAQALLLGVALWILGVPAPVLWGAVTAFASLVPLVGTALVWIPSVIWLFAAGAWVKGIILLVWAAGVVGTVDNLLRPYVMSGKMEMHPLLLLFSLLGGVEAFGMIGMFAGPVILAVTQTLFEILGVEMKDAGVLDDRQ